MPPIPLPCANALETAARIKAADIRNFFFVIMRNCLKNGIGVDSPDTGLINLVTIEFFSG